MMDSTCFMLQDTVPTGRQEVDGKERSKLLFADLDNSTVWGLCLKQPDC